MTDALKAYPWCQINHEASTVALTAFYLAGISRQTEINFIGASYTEIEALNYMINIGRSFSKHRWTFNLIGPKLKEISEEMDLEGGARDNIVISFYPDLYEDTNIKNGLCILRHPGLWVEEFYNWDNCLLKIADQNQPTYCTIEKFENQSDLLNTLLFLFDFERFKIELKENPFTFTEEKKTLSLGKDEASCFPDFHTLRLTPIESVGDIASSKFHINELLGNLLENQGIIAEKKNIIESKYQI